MNKIDYYSFFL